jgi:diaminopimelate decarboxylase/aspartate kinase
MCRCASSIPAARTCRAPRIDGNAAAVSGVKAISRRNGIVLVSMEGIGMWQQVGFLADVFGLFKKHGLSVDLIGSAGDQRHRVAGSVENLVSTDVLARCRPTWPRSAGSR